jgi:3',5'-cyclic-AMP phosphodiesterase
VSKNILLTTWPYKVGISIILLPVGMYLVSVVKKIEKPIITIGIFPTIPYKSSKKIAQRSTEMPTTPNNYTVIQITDPHLFSDVTNELQGYQTYKHLAETIDHILVNPNAKPDMVFVTGDISQDETAESYQLALTQLERFTCPVYWIQGNHDNQAELQPIFDSSRRLQQLTHLSTSYWDFISINTCRRDVDDGYIEDDEYERFVFKLEEAKAKSKKIAVVMHHHPTAVNTPLMDACGLHNQEKFLKLVKQYEEIKLVICGHVHGDYKIALDEFTIETCPATCFQWKKGTSSLETENRRGYKIFHFNSTSYTSSTIFI